MEEEIFAGTNFREHKFSRITNKHDRKKISRFLFSQQGSWCLSTPPTISRMEMATHGAYRRSDSKISTLIKACRSLSAKNCHAKGRELTPRIYLQLRWVDLWSRKISAVCSMLLRQNRSTFRRFTGLRLEGTVLHSLSARKLWRENFFAGTNFRELVFDRENREYFRLAKISRYIYIRYMTGHALCCCKVRTVIY